ncbi:hypothetical protein AJ79_05794 [Helicocarpus griseus UAMH5409]|uniref:Uncharacterized protein n=1 Tax=Helicocarpus griseus UAMH5409 TaxID=1447875 RepID=A0A2B7XJB3_9EURO|nr:hypothetical protein AJ79_05794 [Helicocarpus griseus UAMH5409]
MKMLRKTKPLLLPLLLCLLALSTSTTAQKITNDTECPPVEDIVYSPFKPWFHFYSGSNQLCWITAMCTLAPADEARKQQFGATALIMGLIPLTLKDIAWPERRIALVSAPLPFAAAVIVRALGLEPTVPSDLDATHVQRYMHWMRGMWFANIGARGNGVWTTMRVSLSLVMLLLSYGALAAVEIYSKRSSLGCVYPVFAVTWCIAGVFPAVIHALFAMQRQRQLQQGKGAASTGSISAVQGADEAWPVQLAWGVYYIAGTLVFTSIMAVTVAELAVWVFVHVAVTAASKIFALYICLLLRSPGDDAVREAQD